MLFNSLSFAVFLPLVFALYWALQRAPLRWQNGLILVASFVFYGWWDWRFLSLIVFSSAVDFLVGRRLGRHDAPKMRKVLLGVSLAANLGVLGFFKYYGFFVDTFCDLLTACGLHASGPTLAIVLPVGISFYTFQTLSYTIDIYRRRIEPTDDLIAFFAFVSFFPQLVAGPIERAGNLLPQFLGRRSFDDARARDGMRQILNGFLKKMVIADNLAPLVDDIFAGYQTCDGLTLLIGVFFFAIQIYCDFSGYSDIAIGTARLFGFDLMRNFAFPYFSRDIAEFWRRWHISLSTWFRDYLYIPIGGSRVGRWGQVRNTLITFSVSGLWHGANWTFVAWGVVNGLYFLPLLLTRRNRTYLDTPGQGRLLPGAGEAVAILTTFVLTLVAWVFFRSIDIGSAFGYLGRMVSRPYGGLDYARFVPMLLACAALLTLEWIQREKQFLLQVDDLPVVGRWAVYSAGVLMLLVFGAFGSTEFIYFQF